MKMTHPVPAVVIAVAVTLTQALLGALLAALLLPGDLPGHRLFAALAVTVVAVVLLHGLRRVTRQGWAGVGSVASRRAVRCALLGLAAGAAPVIAGNGLSVALGVAGDAPPGAGGLSALPYLPAAVLIIVLGQAFPEELVWRGHLYDTLSGRLSPPALTAVLAAGFGAMHILSRSPADGLAERLLYVVTATGLGLVCTVARTRTGSLWAAVGVHTGFHLGNTLLPVQPVRYGAQLVLLAGLLALTGWVISGAEDCKQRTRPLRRWLRTLATTRSGSR